MQHNASKITGVQSAVMVGRDGIDVEQLREEATDMIKEASAPALVRFAMNNRAAVKEAVQYAKTHPLMVKALGAAVATGMIAVPAAASDAVFGINATDIDTMFEVLNNHIMPDVGGTISAMPAIIIPIVILIVLIVILMFVPELLYSLLDMLRDAFKIRR